jgi:hypothetical protein
MQHGMHLRMHSLSPACMLESTSMHTANYAFFNVLRHVYSATRERSDSKLSGFSHFDGAVAA